MHKSIASDEIVEITLFNSKQKYLAYLCLSNLSFDVLLAQKYTFLNSQELLCLDSHNFQKRQKTYLLGRYCAKWALKSYMLERQLPEILITNGVFGQPVVSSAAYPNIQVSISHTDDWGAAISFPEEHPMAIDIENVDLSKKAIICSELLASEIAIIQALELSEAAMYTLIWTVKEGLAKAIKTGITSPLSIYEVSSIISVDNYFLSTFKNFSQYKAISFLLSNIICTIIMPGNSEFDLIVCLKNKTGVYQ